MNNQSYLMWLVAWLALWVILVAVADLNPQAGPLVGVFALGISLAAIGELIYNGKLQAGLRELGVPV